MTQTTDPLNNEIAALIAALPGHSAPTPFFRRALFILRAFPNGCGKLPAAAAGQVGRLVGPKLEDIACGILLRLARMAKLALAEVCPG
jgi:hypothetical protein